jgi:protein-S-isoprenylcysteine O-methyltransferase Ste14
MEKIVEKAEELAGTVKEYVNNRIESVKLGVAEKSSAIIANLVAGAIAMAVFFFFLLFAGIALSFALGDWLGKTWAGFLIVAMLYLLLGIIIWSARTRLIRLPVMNSLIRQLINKEEKEDYEED